MMINILVGVLALAQASYDECSHLSSPQQTIQALAKAIDDINCAPMKIGARKIVNVARGSGSPTGLGMTYVVRRRSEKRYEVELNPYFVESYFAMLASYQSEETVNTAKIRKRVEACIGLANRHFWGPEGQSLTLKLAPRASAQREHQEIETSIQVVCNNPRHRDNMKQYGENIGCYSIVHELLHLTGLVDEYPDRDYDCRVESANSIMSSGSALFDSALSTPLDISGCICPAENPYCDLNNLSKGCPSGSVSFLDQNYRHPKGKEFPQHYVSYRQALIQYEKFLKPPQLLSPPPDLVVTKAKAREEKKKSILRPAHFRAIVSPLCREKNNRYYTCAQFSYQFSLKVMSWELSSCGELPPECRDDSWLD